MDTFRESDVDPRGAFSPSLDGKLVLHDGAKRDRDPYVGDVAVSGLTQYLTHQDGTAAKNVLADLADHQRADGWIPPASINNYTLPLFDYPLWWVTSSWDYVLYTGDTAYAASYYSHLVKTLDAWYPSVTDSRGLLAKGLNGTGGYGDYAFLPRTGEVTYYNALYVRALQGAAGLARATGHAADADRWLSRASGVAAAVNQYLWDPAAGAYLDSATGAVRHGQDGNSQAILAGIASPAQAVFGAGAARGRGVAVRESVHGQRHSRLRRHEARVRVHVVPGAAGAVPDRAGGVGDRPDQADVRLDGHARPGHHGVGGHRRGRLALRAGLHVGRARLVDRCRAGADERAAGRLADVAGLRDVAGFAEAGPGHVGARRGADAEGRVVGFVVSGGFGVLSDGDGAARDVRLAGGSGRALGAAWTATRCGAAPCPSAVGRTRCWWCGREKP